MCGLESRQRVLVGDGAGTPVGVADGKAEQTLAQARPHLDGSPISSQILSDQARIGIDVPVVETAGCAFHAFAQDTGAFAKGEIIGLALLDAVPTTRPFFDVQAYAGFVRLAG